MYKNKIIVIIVLAIILGIVLSVSIALYISSQNNNRNNENKNITLNYLGYSYTQTQLQPLFDKYEKLNPKIKINYLQIDKEDYKNYLANRLKSTKQDLVPDLFENNNSDQLLFSHYVSYAPKTIITSEELTQEYYGIYKRGLVKNDKVTGIPENLSPLIIAYNQDILKNKNIPTDKIFSSLDNFNQYSAKIADDKIASINIGKGNNLTTSSDILQLFMLENNTSMNKTDLESSFNSEEGKGALEYYNTFINGEFRTRWNSSSPLSDIKSFANETLAMIFIYPEELNKIKSINPNLKINYGLFPSSITNVQLAKYDYLTVSLKSTNSTESWKLVKYMTSSDSLKTIARSITSEENLIPPRKDMNYLPKDTNLTNSVKKASLIATDWSMPTSTYTQDVFNKIINNTYKLYGTGSILNKGVSDINSELNKEYLFR